MAIGVYVGMRARHDYEGFAHACWLLHVMQPNRCTIRTFLHVQVASARYVLEGLSERPISIKPDHLVLPPGTRFTIRGLQSRPELNGRAAKVVSSDGVERYTVTYVHASPLLCACIAGELRRRRALHGRGCGQPWRAAEAEIRDRRAAARWRLSTRLYDTIPEYKRACCVAKRFSCRNLLKALIVVDSGIIGGKVSCL